jgi:hypothetical protein
MRCCCRRGRRKELARPGSLSLARPAPPRAAGCVALGDFVRARVMFPGDTSLVPLELGEPGEALVTRAAIAAMARSRLADGTTPQVGGWVVGGRASPARRLLC